MISFRLDTTRQAAAARTRLSPARASMIDAEPLTVLLVHLPPRPTTSLGRSPVRTGGLPQKEGVFTDLWVYGDYPPTVGSRHLRHLRPLRPLRVFISRIP